MKFFVLFCTGVNWNRELETKLVSAVFQSEPFLCCRLVDVVFRFLYLLHFVVTMRRTTLGTLNIGNQGRQIVREKKTSLGPRSSIGSRTSVGRTSTSGRPSLANPRSATGRYVITQFLYSSENSSFNDLLI